MHHLTLPSFTTAFFTQNDVTPHPPYFIVSAIADKLKGCHFDTTEVKLTGCIENMAVVLGMVHTCIRGLL
jgi:hypothetical protein